VAKYEFVEVYLELGFAYTVVRANEPLLEVANSSIGKWDGRLRTFSQLRAERLDARDMFKTGLDETCETFEAVRIDGGTRCNVPSKYRDYRAGLKVRNHAHASSTGGSSALLHGHQNESRPSILELPAPSQPGLLAANPRVVNLYLTAQGLPSRVYHRPTEFVQHHPRGLVAGKTKLTL
jgi:hypothetical protein